MSLVKTVLTDAIEFAKANEAEVLGFVTPILDKLAAGVVTEASALIAKIPDQFALIRSVLAGFVSEYGPELPGLIAKFEGTAFDKVIAFLEAEVAKLP